MPKQLRLSTALLLTTVLALAAGLCTQQLRHNAAIENARKNEWLVSRFYTDELLANRVLMYKPERFDAWSRTKVVTLIRELWKNEQRYDNSAKGPYTPPTARGIAATVLRTAKISSHQQLVDYGIDQTFYDADNEDDASYLNAEGIPARVPELHDSSSRDYASFKEFVERALQ